MYVHSRHEIIYIHVGIIIVTTFDYEIDLYDFQITIIIRVTMVSNSD